jgi:hypothetical protein
MEPPNRTLRSASRAILCRQPVNRHRCHRATPELAAQPQGRAKASVSDDPSVPAPFSMPFSVRRANWSTLRPPHASDLRSAHQRTGREVALSVLGSDQSLRLIRSIRFPPKEALHQLPICTLRARGAQGRAATAWAFVASDGLPAPDTEGISSCLYRQMRQAVTSDVFRLSLSLFHIARGLTCSGFPLRRSWWTF